MNKITKKQLIKYISEKMFDIQYNFELVLTPVRKNSTIIWKNTFKGQGYCLEAEEFINCITSHEKVNIYLREV